RLATTYSVVGAVIGEYVGSGEGLGKFLQRSYRSFQTDQVFLAVAIIAGLSIVLVALVTLVEMLTLRWRYAGKTSRFTQFFTNLTDAPRQTGRVPSQTKEIPT
ncbi:MAG: ABC transporter permease subunit, partial [Chloroflexota bacterium]